MIAQGMTTETNDAVNLIVSLLVRFPEITSVHSNPADQTIRLTFAISAALAKERVAGVIDEVVEHLVAYHEVADDQTAVLGVDVDVDQGASFLHVDRDLKSISKEEIALLVDLLKDRFAEQLIVNPVVTEEPAGDDAAAEDEPVNVAIDAMREGGSPRSLVGFREERRVLIYFKKVAKKKKAAKK